MKILRHFSLLLTMTLAIPGHSHAQQHSRAYDNVKNQATEAMKQLDAGNYDAYAGCLYETMLTQLGGPAAAPGAIKQSNEMLKRAGWKITRSVGEPSDPVSADGKEFSVLPTVVTMESASQKMVTKSYVIGVSTNYGAAWKFVDCNSIPEEGVRKWLVPDLPASVTLPKAEEPQITKK